MKIIGKVKKDQNFTYVYTKDAVYTLPHNANSWACRKVGELTATGVILTQEWIDKQREKCVKEGTFELA
jgi:hypothetical protein